VHLTVCPLLIKVSGSRQHPFQESSHHHALASGFVS
jgi:hypothetical protein